MSQIQDTKIRDLSRLPLIDVRKKQTHVAIGFTGAGKSATDERIARKLIKAGQTCFDAYGGDLQENMFWSTTLDCVTDESYPCKCHGFEEDTARMPMTVFVPEDFVLMDDRDRTENDVNFKNPLKAYNNNYFSKFEYDKYEINRAKANGISLKDLSIIYDKNNPPQKPQGKPRQDWIKFVPIPKPQLTGKGVGIFDKPNNCIIRDIFIDEMDKARNAGGRIVVFSPGLFPQEFYRYQSLNIMIRSIRELKFKKFLPPIDPVGLIEENKDKLFVILREIGQLLNNEMKSDESGYSTLAKKAIQYYIRLGRQWGCGAVMDAQNLTEVYKNIRVLVDVIWVKYGPRWLFGETWDFLFDRIAAERKGILEDLGYNEYGYNVADNEWPEITKLLPNYAYAVRKESNDPLLVETPLPDHHHWDPEHGDEIRQITGIYWGYKEMPNQKVVSTDDSIKPGIDYGNSYEMITGIRNAPKDVIKEWGKKYKMELPKKLTWREQYQIYLKLVEEKKITSGKVFPSWTAMKIWYNRQATPKE